MNWGQILDNSLSAFFGIDAVYFILAAVGLNVQFGYAGLLNFGQAAFMACGAYGLGMTAHYFGVSFWWGIAFGLGYAIVLALIVGVPTLRLRADYLAIVTIAMAEMIRLIVRSVTFKRYFGGSDGLRGYTGRYRELSWFNPAQRYGIGPLQANGPVAGVIVTVLWAAVAVGIAYLVVTRFRPLASRVEHAPRVPVVAITAVVVFGLLLLLFQRITYLGYTMWTLVIGWILVGFVAVFVWALMRSPWGRVLKGIREDEDAVRSLGKNVFGYKMSALIIGACIGMLSGMVLALDRGSVQPDNYSRNVTFYILTALVLGGTAKVSGSIIGPMIFWALLAFTENFLTQAADAQGRVKVFGATLIRSSSEVGQVRLMLVGLGLMLLMVFRPQGIFGNRREMALDGR